MLALPLVPTLLLAPSVLVLPLALRLVLKPTPELIPGTCTELVRGVRIRTDRFRCWLYASDPDPCPSLAVASPVAVLPAPTLSPIPCG